MSNQKRDAEIITLGSGDLMVKEYTDTMPEYTGFDASTDLLGCIKGGATLEYSGEWYTAKDDTGKAVKTIITEEEVSPGITRLMPQRAPQKLYHQKLGSTVTQITFPT